MIQRYVIYLIFLMSLGFIRHANAEFLKNHASMVPLSPDKFYEVLDPKPDVSGSTLVGFRLGKSADNIDVENIFIVAPSKIPPFVCIDATTKDGRFSAENLYTIESKDKKAKIAKVIPIAVSSNSKKALEQYPGEQLAIRAYQSSDNTCIATNAVFLPHIIEDSVQPKNLYVLVNAGSRIASGSIEIAGSGKKESIMGICTPSNDSASLTYNTICSFELPDLKSSQEIIVNIDLDDGFGEDRESARVRIPSEY